MSERVIQASATAAGAPRALTARKRWQLAVFQLRKNSAIAKLDVDNDDETVYDGKFDLLQLEIIFD